MEYVLFGGLLASIFIVISTFHFRIKRVEKKAKQVEKASKAKINKDQEKKG